MVSPHHFEAWISDRDRRLAPQAWTLPCLLMMGADRVVTHEHCMFTHALDGRAGRQKR